MNLSKWTKQDVVAALARGGYLDDNIVSAVFAGVNENRQAMFDIAYDTDDGSGELGYGKVFVYIDKSGELVADY